MFSYIAARLQASVQMEGFAYSLARGAFVFTCLRKVGSITGSLTQLRMMRLALQVAMDWTSLRRDCTAWPVCGRLEEMASVVGLVFETWDGD